MIDSGYLSDAANKIVSFQWRMRVSEGGKKDAFAQLMTIKNQRCLRFLIHKLFDPSTSTIKYIVLLTMLQLGTWNLRTFSSTLFATNPLVTRTSTSYTIIMSSSR